MFRLRPPGPAPPRHRLGWAASSQSPQMWRSSRRLSETVSLLERSKQIKLFLISQVVTLRILTRLLYRRAVQPLPYYESLAPWPSSKRHGARSQSRGHAPRPSCSIPHKSGTLLAHDLCVLGRIRDHLLNRTRIRDHLSATADGHRAIVIPFRRVGSQTDIFASGLNDNIQPLRPKKPQRAR
jgi:hypothetical protein